MYLKPLTQFVRSLVTGKRRWTRRVYRPLTNRERRRMGIGSWLSVAAPAQMLEERAMLSGPSLVQVVPNTTGVAITNNQLQTEAPKELTFTFSPGSSIDASTLAAGISITRSGVDSAFGDANDQTITPGFMGVAVAGNGTNQVTLRFADTLPDDIYRISITGALKNTANESFNNGVTQTLDFRVDYGAQVISLVPQPVLRTEKLNVLNFSKISDLDKFTVTAGGAPVTFQFKNTATSSVVGAGNTAVLYSSADTAATLAAKINTAINTKFGAGGAVSSTVNTTAISLAGDAFTPSIKITTAQSGALSVTDGGLVQKRDTIVAYFNQDTLNAALAQDPGYYQVINTADGSILLPSSVKYDSVSNTAVLKFSGDIPGGTFHLTIGAPNAAQNTLATAVVAGTLFGNTGGYSVNGFLGNANHTGVALNDVDLYQFNTTAATTVTINASNLASGLGANVVLRLFDSNGVQVAMSVSNSLNVNLAAGGTYYVGVSSSGNAAYNPVTGLGVVNGAGVGSYKLGITVANAVTLNNDTTSFATSTNLGTLGTAGQKISDAIQPLGNLAYPTLPGGADEPGHRDINIPGENNGGNPWSVGIPGAIPTYYYNFQDVYGVDPQNNILHNAITEEQKNLARQVFQIYGSYLGIEFVETDNQGLTVVTGDTRAVDPSSPPDALGGIFGASSIGTLDAIINAGAVPGGASQYGGTWFNIAFHEIGHALGLEHSYDAPSVMGQGVGGNSGVEAVYPGDINLVPAQNLNAPVSTDINLYKFQVTQAGTLSAQTIAQRLKDVNGNNAPSLLDTVITLYQESPSGVRTIVARNDDYFGRDSFVNLHLDSGTYYLAVSSTGNTNFDPAVSDTGFGGRTDGNYQLKLDFTVDPPATATLNDALGVALDGDANAATGGVFNFWFQSNTAANTIFVDKANSADLAQNGTIGHAYSTIAAAIATATPGQVIRIVGNGGTDGDPATLSDDKAYLIGFDTLNNAAADGTTFKVPKGVTVMIDAGAILKFRGAVIDVGDSVPNVDRSGSSLQVLGTPQNNVYFTSLRDNAKGGNTDPTNFGSAQGGDWGGIVYRQPSDVQGKDYAGNGIYLNSVNQANISYGGGQVLEDSVLQVFDPIHISNPDPNADFFARPAIRNNTITNSADAAISADPNSFFNSLDRVGPDIHGNKVTGNTINGLFIRVRTQLGESIDKLGVSARLDDSDITYVLTENLLIEGNPGGPVMPDPSDPTHTGWDARIAGSLIIDPGVIVKLSGARIEAQVGASQIIAEGTAAHPIVFTSLKDDTYGGGGGTFDVGADGLSTPAAGDYGGLFFNSSSSGSIDHARILYAGGTTPIAGGFTQFNPIEIQQAHVRVTNTLFQNNADGVTGEDQDPSNGNRNGLLSNTGRTAGTGPATIFVRGSQPIIVGNTFVDNAGNVLSFNANALSSLQIVDWGRSTGAIDDFEQFVNNKGPLVRLNTYTGNGTNGMEVRGETITTETIWDDTDIVHVVRDEIADTVNLHTYGGIRLQSSPEASLVVKLSGANAGFTANGTPLDINDRIGGTIQIIGTPGHPVVLTALEDDTVGAGFDPSGQPQNDTNNDGTNTDKPLQFPPSTGPLTITKTTSGQTLLNSMVIRPVASGVTLGTATYSGGADAAGTYKNGGNVPLGIYPTGALITTGNAALPTSNTEAGFGDEMDTDGDPRLDALIAASGTTTTEASVLTFTVTVAPGSGIHSGRFSFVFGSDEYPEFINSRYNDVVGAFVNGGAETNFLRDSKGNLISVNNAFFNVDNTDDSLNIEYDGLTQALTASFPLREGVNTISIAIGDASDPILDSGIFLTDLRFSTDVVGKGGVTAVPKAGAWRSVALDQYSNDTNVAVVVETERIADKKDTNGTPATAEFLGNLAPNANGDTPDNSKGGNDDQALGFEVHGFLNKASDADVYSFNGVGGTEVWFDIGRTSNSLDTVVELIDANGIVLASSNDSLNDATLGGSAMSMTKDAHLGGDFYTTNPRDAGFRALLPGQTGTTGTYFLRVRSNNAATQGEYQLQIRLQQTYEHPGSTIRYSDIRYATNGIEVHGLPGHSPLSGTSASVGTNNSFQNAQGLGNLLASDQNTISVSGSLASSAQVDWYKLNIDFDLIQAIGGVNGAAKTWATIFDIDYADGLARPDLIISVFDSTGKLILISRNSDIASDQPGPLQGNDLDDLSKGSVGKLDPYIGSIMMPAGVIAGSNGVENGNGTPVAGARTYYVSISSNAQLPQVLSANFKSDATADEQLVRLQPIDSVKRIVEDHIGLTGYLTGYLGGPVAQVPPQTGPILPIATSADLALTIRPFTLADVALYTTSTIIDNDGGNDNKLYIINPFSGSTEVDVGQIDDPRLHDVQDIKFRQDGKLFVYQSNVNRSNFQNNAGSLGLVDPSGAVETLFGNDSIPDLPNPPPNPQTDFNPLTTNSVGAMAWLGINTITNDPQYILRYAVNDFDGFYNNGAPASRMYAANPASGSAARDDNLGYGVRGEIVRFFGDSGIGMTTGMAYHTDSSFFGTTLYGVSTGGLFYSIDFDGTAHEIANFSSLGMSFAGLTLGPQNVEGGAYKDLLFAITNDGRMIALNTSGEMQPIFEGGATIMQTNIVDPHGLTFAPLDFNLWHPTTFKATDDGHGVDQSFNNGNLASAEFLQSVNGRRTSYGEGGASFYFGLETWAASHNSASQDYLTYDGINAQYGILNPKYQEFLTSPALNTGIGNNYNLPGGAYGSLITKSFNLEGYSSSDLPTLYFNYFLDTQNASGTELDPAMLDSARVYVTTDGGVTWSLLATNNSARSTIGIKSELPQYATAQGSDAVYNSPFSWGYGQGQEVQELFDTSSWRQARVDLSRFAGAQSLQLRFDFSTAGSSMKSGTNENLPGDGTSKGSTDKGRLQDNNHVGFLVDDLMIGLAGRGEMVSGVAGGAIETTYFAPNPSIESDPNILKQHLTGAYQLEVRRGTEYTFGGSTITPGQPYILIDPSQLISVNAILAPGYSIQPPTGSTLVDGQTFVVTDGVKTLTFEFDSNGSVTAGNRSVSFTSSDTSIKVARSIRDSINTAASLGLFKVTASLADGNINGTNSTNDRVDLYQATNVTSIGAIPDVTVSVSQTSVSENGGTATGTVSIAQALAANLTVALSVINPATGLPATDVQVPATVTILANQLTANFTITGFDDLFFNGLRTIVIRPTAVGYTGVSAPLDVTDNDPGLLTLVINNNAAGLVEGNTRSATVTRNSPTDQALIVSLASLNTGEISVPQTVVIPAGQASVSFIIGAVQDGIIDGDRAVTILATAAGYAPGSASVTVLDSLVNTALPFVSVGMNVDITKKIDNQAGGVIAIDRTNPNQMFMASNDANLGGLIAAYSNDGGQTWTKRALATGAAGDGLIAGLRDPSLATDEYGNLFLAYIAANGKDIVVAASVDFGQSFSVVTTFSSVTTVEQPKITAAKFDTAGNKGSVWVSWRDNAANRIVTAGAQTTSKSISVTFGSPQQVPGSGTWKFGDIAIGPNGQVLVAYQTSAAAEGPTDILVSVDSNGLAAGGFSLTPTAVTSTGVGFGDHIPASPNGTSAGVGLAWDRTGGPNNGRLYMIYADESPGESNDTNVYLRYSDNSGATWSNPIRVNDDSSTNSQFLPKIAIDQTTGNLAITWYDSRNDVGGTGLVSTLISPGSGGLNTPTAATIGPDGNLYVASRVSNQILRYDGTTGAFLGIFVQQGSGGLLGPNGLAFGPDGNLYVSSLNTDSILRYNGTTGAFIDVAVTAGSNGLDAPSTLIFHTDGFLYALSNGSDTVLRFNNTTLAFDKIFVAAKAGNLDDGRDMTFGPDGNLYVTNRTNGNVLRYDGSSGSFINAFVPSFSGGLFFPSALAFGPDNNLYVSNDAFGQVLRYNGTSGAFIDEYVSSGSGLTNPVDLLWRQNNSLNVVDSSSSSVRRVISTVGGTGDTDGIANNDAQYFGAIVSYSNGVLTVGSNFQISDGTSSAKLAQSSTDFGPFTGLDFFSGKLAPLWADNSVDMIDNPDLPTLDQATANITVTPATVKGLLTVAINLASISEAGGSTSASVTLRDTNGNPVLVTGAPLIVSLSVNTPGLANVPSTVTIPVGQSSVNFNITAINNSVAAGNQTLVVSPSLTQYEGVGANVQVIDNEVPTLTLTSSASLLEGGTLTGTVTRNSPTDVDLTVFLFSTDVTEATVPVTVVIPAGQASATFTISGVEDYQLDGTHSPRIIAVASGMASGRRLLNVFDSQTLSSLSYNDLGDRNLPRRQGVINISSNTIRDVAETGILVSASPRDGGDANLPHPASVISTPTLNSDKLIPGPQISNNVIYNFGETGIQFSGDANAAGNSIAGVPYGRIVNNSIYAGASAHGTGILVSNNAAPTLLNNIVSNTSLGISIDSTSSAKTVVGTTLFKGNTSNGVLGTNAIVLSAAQPLFNNPSTGNFYLAPGSLAIDSSLNTLVDRPSIVAVKSPLGIPQSPIIAPSLDRFGQLRIDEPSVPNANGLGQNIFKDRGALERADFAGPTARLNVPEDNSIADGDPAVGRFVVITPAPLIEFDIVLEDQGIGIDNSTVSSSAFVLKQDPGTPDEKVLVNGVDYIFSYNENTHTAAFKAVSVFPPASTYTITLDTTVVKDSAGNALQPNKPDGTSVFMIVGNAPPTLTNVSLLPGLRNVVNSISYATLLANSDLKVITTHTPDFRIESVVAGTLTISKGGAPAVAVVPGTTLIEPGDVLFWDPPAGAEGQTAAFTVIGYDPENAVIAPALSLSITGPVTVSLNLVNVAPTLTTINKLPTNALEDTVYSITYNDLKNQSDLVDQNNDSPLSFLITEVTTGTLQISINNGPYVAVVPGTTTLGPNDVLRWQAPANQNNDLNGSSPFNAFKVLATDGDATSALPAVQVKIDVDADPDAPIMTTLTKFGVGGLNSQFPILYADLVSHSNVQNVDGHPIQFRIESIASGATLKIKHLGVVSTVVPGTATAIVSAGDSLFWTPPLGVFGTSVPAFNVVAYDGLNSFPFNTSTLPGLTANVEVLNSPAPTLSTIATFTRPRYVPTPLTFSDIQAASNVTIAAGHTLGFRIESIETGVLQITHLGATTVAGPGTIVVAGDTLTWASAPGATDLNNAFKVVAVDLTNTLVSLEPIQVQVNLINFAPTLSTVTPFGGAIQQTPYNITYASLQAAANEFDANNDALGFRIRWVFNGTLLITKSGTSTAVPVVNAQTLVQPGDVLTWTGGVGQNGAIPAFAIRAWDGVAGSGVDITVTVNVAAFGTQYSLSGPWVVGGKLARINQVGANLTLSDQNGVGSAGSYTSFNTITGRNGLTGIVDTTTPDNGRIVWSDGAIWLKLSVGGQYYIPAAGDALVKVIQNGVALKFYNKFGDSADASFISPTLISIPKWNLTATYADGALNISNGVQWKKLDLSPTYTDSATGQKVGVIQRTDTTELTFVDTVGGTSSGLWTSPTQVTATAWGKTGIVKNGQIVWSDGSIWNKSLVVVGTGSGAGPGFVTITATNNQILLTNKLGTVMRAQIIDPYTLYNIDTGKTIIRKNGKLDLGGGLIWADFDYNALDAVFSDIKTFPFGS